MRILFTMTGSWGTGSGTVIEAISSELMERGHEVTVLCPEAQYEVDKELEKYVVADEEIWHFPIRRGNVSLHTFPLMIPDPNPSNLRDAPTFRDLSQEQIDLYITSFQKKFKEVVASFQPDVVECQHIWLMPYAVSRLGHPYIVTAHHSDQMGFQFDQRIRPYATEAARNAERIFAITEANRNEVLELYGVPEEKVFTILNGYDQEVFRPMEVDRKALFEQYELAIPNGAPVVTFAGKLSKTKGVDILLMANRLIQQRRPVHVIMFGTGEWDTVLHPALKDSYSFENIHMMGHQPYEMIARFHNVAEVSVMPSRTEGFGLAALEAMGCGTPVVVTRTGGPDQYAVGSVVEPEDAISLADEVLRIIDLPYESKASLRKTAHERARVFSWSGVADQRLNHYMEVAEAYAERA